MKIYRVMPFDIQRYTRFTENGYINVEDIYYNAGYISFRNKDIHHTNNNIYREIPKEEYNDGKYFFLFIEDAITKGHILNRFHNTRYNHFFIAEYNIPEDLILKYIGYGDYTFDIIKDYALECFIKKSDFLGQIEKSNELDENFKIDALISSLNQLLINDLCFKFDNDFYTKLFKVEDLASVINNEEAIKRVLLNCSYYNSFLQTSVDLIKTPYITGKIIAVNDRQLFREYKGRWNSSEYFKQFGLDADFSEKQKDFKNDLLSYAGLYNKEKDSDKIKSLLKERKYI